MKREINREEIGKCAVLSQRVDQVGVGHSVGNGVILVMGDLSFIFKTAEDAEVFAADFNDSIRLAWPERGN